MLGRWTKFLTDMIKLSKAPLPLHKKILIEVALGTLVGANFVDNVLLLTRLGFISPTRIDYLTL